MIRTCSMHALLVLSHFLWTSAASADASATGPMIFQIPDCGELAQCSYLIDGQPASEFAPSNREEVNGADSNILSIELRDEYSETRDFLEAEPDANMLTRLRPGKWRIGAGFGAFRAPQMSSGSEAMKGNGSGIALSLMRRCLSGWALMEFHRERESRIDRVTNTIIESRFDSVVTGWLLQRPLTGQNGSLPLHYAVGASIVGGLHKDSETARNVGSDELGNITVSIDRKSGSTRFLGMDILLQLAMPATDGVWFSAKIDLQYLRGQLHSGREGNFAKSTAYLSMFYGF